MIVRFLKSLWKKCNEIVRRILAFVKRTLSKKQPEPPKKRPATPGLTCPRCEHHIELSIPLLLSGAPIICSHCFLHLQIDQQRSQESLGALHKLHSSFQTAQRMIDESRLN